MTSDDHARRAKVLVQRATRAVARRFKRQQGILWRKWVAPRRPPSDAPLWIHIGCGDVDDPRFVNVDARPLSHIHHVTDQPSLIEFPDGCAQLIYASHVFEHVSHRVQRELLDSWVRVLAPGGVLRLAVPDFEALIAIYVEGGRNVERVQNQLMGGQDYPTNYHYALFTEAHLGRLLRDAGLIDVRPWAPGSVSENWVDDASKLSYSLNLEATKPRGSA